MVSFGSDMIPVDGYWDEANQRIVLEEIVPQGGEIILAGQIVVVEDQALVAEPEDDFGAEPLPDMTLEEMADVALTYRPDASVAPELFADANAATLRASLQSRTLGLRLHVLPTEAHQLVDRRHEGPLSPWSHEDCAHSSRARRRLGARCGVDSSGRLGAARSCAQVPSSRSRWKMSALPQTPV